MTTGLPDFFKYNLWANLRLLDACANLSDAQLDTTMIGTFGCHPEYNEESRTSAQEILRWCSE